MSVKRVSRMGCKHLATPSKQVEKVTSALAPLFQDMYDTMQAKKGVGIAAPQIGVNKRIIIFGYDVSDRYPNEEPIPLTILINPSFEILDEELISSWEGCLSIPGIRGLVPRYKKIKYQGLDPLGNVVSRTAQDFHARVVQHECDHINGILYPERMKNMREFGFEEEMVDRLLPKKG